jgi:3',5'-cyclic AMP phosphodiesterase CpdA
MLKFSSARSWLLGSLALLFLAASGCSDDAAPTATPTPGKLLVFSDPHYFDPSLGTTGSAFEAYVARDRKLIAESDAVFRAMVAAVQAENPQAILIAGDLTKDGEQASHQKVAAYLHQMRSGGRKVFVVPGNHDIQNDAAQSYAGDVATPAPTISAADFANIYSDMGYAAAIARDPTSLSYVAEIFPGLWLLALDSCIYGDVRAPAASSGRFTEATKAWIQTQLDLATSRGVRVLGMMHHGLVEHFTNQAAIFPEYLVADRDAVAGLLSNGGVGAVFTGHFHANDITQGLPSGAARTIYDIETGSTVTYACPYRIVDASTDALAITTKHVTAIDYDLQGAPDFQTYAHDRLRVGLETLIPELMAQAQYTLTDAEAAEVSPWLGDGLVAHYAGDEVMPANVPGEVQTLMFSGNGVELLAGMMLQSIWTDLPPADNTLVLDLAAR